MNKYQYGTVIVALFTIATVAMWPATKQAPLTVAPSDAVAAVQVSAELPQEHVRDMTY